MEEQMVMSQLLRRKQQAEALANANSQGHGLDPLAAIAQMANNPGAAAAAQMAAKSRQSQYKPEKMGNQGFMLPATGESVASPMFEDEQAANHLLRKSLADQTNAQREAQLAQQKELARERIEAQKAMQAARLAQQASQAEQSRLFRGALAGVAGAGRTARGAEKAAEKGEKDREKAISKYSLAMEKAGAPEFSAALEIAEGNLNKYPEGKLPAYGRLLSAVPKWALNDNDQTLRTDFSSAANILLKARSGAAVTNPEHRRFLEEVASGAGMSEKAMRKGWSNIREHFDNKRQNLNTLLDDKGHEEYIARGGDDNRVKPKAAKPAAKPTDAPPPKGVSPEDWKHLTHEERALWK